MASVSPCEPIDPSEWWKPIPEYESLYLVSNWARVWSILRTTKGRPNGGALLAPVHAGRPGYQRLRVTLCSGGRKRQIGVHQIVMLAFVGTCPEGQEIRHLDGNEFNNRWEPGDEAESRAAGGNLFYGSHKKNAQDMVEHGRAMGCGKLGAEHPKAKLTEDLVRQIRSEYDADDVTERDLSAKYGVNVSTLHRLLVRQTWKHVA